VNENKMINKKKKKKNWMERKELSIRTAKKPQEIPTLFSSCFKVENPNYDQYFM
jgi:hypothetical protein